MVETRLCRTSSERRQAWIDALHRLYHASTDGCEKFKAMSINADGRNEWIATSQVLETFQRSRYNLSSILCRQELDTWESHGASSRMAHLLP